MNKKIAILTQPLHDNYGGLLQAYALSKTLKDLGNEVLIVDRRSGHSSTIRKIASKIKHFFLGNKTHKKFTSKQQFIVSQYTLKFRKKYLPNTTHEITDNRGMSELNKMGFDAYVVGSDQCWRPRYSPNITNYFLDFVEAQNNIKRIAYAASFGTADWEFTAKDTEACKALIQKFDAVSVREDSGIHLCKKYLNTDADHVLDPTMLLLPDDYKTITKQENQTKSNGNLKVYILDKTSQKLDLIKYIEKKIDLKHFEVMPQNRLGHEKIVNIEDYVFPAPEAWLRGYEDAKFVVADSFHGTVFAILYNVPFIAIGNKNRGMARFESLLRMFELEDRLITDFEAENIDNILKSCIDWNKVNNILEEKRQYALNFLKDNLN